MLPITGEIYVFSRTTCKGWPFLIGQKRGHCKVLRKKCMSMQMGSENAVRVIDCYYIIGQ